MFLFRSQHSNEATLACLCNVRGSARFCCGRMSVRLFEHAHTHAHTPPPAAVGGVKRIARLRPNQKLSERTRKAEGHTRDYRSHSFPGSHSNSHLSNQQTQEQVETAASGHRGESCSAGRSAPHTQNSASPKISVKFQLFFFSHHSFVYLFAPGLLFNQPHYSDYKTAPRVFLILQELEKLASRKLKINAKETMKIAEKLYTQG